MKYGRQRQKQMQRKPLISSLKPIRTNTQRPLFLYRKIVKSYWPFMIFLPNIGRVYEQATRLNPPFGTIRHRTRRCKGCLNRDGMLYMMFKLGQCAEKKWRKLRGFDYLAKVIKGIQFSDGIEVIPEIRIAA